MHQLFTCDETGLNWKMLQDTTLADSSKRSARGFKISKERVTLLATANASGDFRLPLVVIHNRAKTNILNESERILFTTNEYLNILSVFSNKLLA